MSPTDRSGSSEGFGAAALQALSSGMPASEVWSLLLLAALARLEQHGYAFGERKIKLLATERFAAHAQRVAAAVDSPPVIHALLEHDYYDGMRFNIFVRAPAGDEIPFIDGGAFDWLRKLMSNQKRVFVASAMGSQLAAFLFGKA